MDELDIKRNDRLIGRPIQIHGPNLHVHLDIDLDRDASVDWIDLFDRSSMPGIGGPFPYLLTVHMNGDSDRIQTRSDHLQDVLDPLDHDLIRLLLKQGLLQ